MLHIFNLMNPQAPVEVFPNDVVVPMIVAGQAARADARRHIEQDKRELDKMEAEDEKVKKITNVGSLIAADRLALRRTLAFVERRWRDGATVDETFDEAEKFRQSEYKKISTDKSRNVAVKQYLISLARIGSGIIGYEMEKTLVDDAPLSSRKIAAKSSKAKPVKSPSNALPVPKPKP